MKRIYTHVFLHKILPIFLILYILTFLPACNYFLESPHAKLSIQNKNISYLKGDIDIKMDFPQIDTSTQSNSLIHKINRDICVVMAQVVPTSDKFTLEMKQGIDNPKQLKEAYIRWATDFVSPQPNENKVDFIIPYQISSQWKAFYNDKIVSIYIQSYAFTGGAHGMFDARFLNFFRVDSKLFELAPFVQDTLALMDLARKEFCRQRALPLNATTEQTTLFVELADLPMPSLMGFTSKGLELAYAPYEIAPWSTGAITITLPMSSLKNVFKSNLKLFD